MSPTPLLDQATHPGLRLLRQPNRLRIVRELAAAGPTTFPRLGRKLRLTDGNLSVHALKLENADVIACTKGFDGRRPCTTYWLTAHGRALLKTFLAMERQEREA